MVVLNNLKFGDGLIFLDKTQVYLAPMNYFLTFSNFFFNELSKDKLRFFFKDSSKYDMKFLFDELSETSNNKKLILNGFLKHINCLGYGEIVLKSFKDDEFIFFQKSPHLGIFYKQIFGKNSSFYLEEIIAGFIENFLGCMYKNNFLCEISDFGGSLVYKVKKLDTDYKKVDSFRYPIFKKGIISNTVKKLILTDKIEAVDGIIKMSGMAGFFFPYFMMIDFFGKLNELENLKVKVFLERLGVMQGKASVDMHCYFGIKKGVDSVKAVYDLSDISGLGKLNYNINYPLKLNVCDNLFFYKNFFPDESVDLLKFHFFSIYKGIFDFSFDLNFYYDELDKGDVIFFDSKKELFISDLDKEITDSLNTKILITNFS